MSLAALKKQSDFSSLIDEYNKQTTPQTESRSFDDERIWKPELDKSGNGYAVIRFLPAPEGEDIPWQRMFHIPFRGQEAGILRTVSPLSTRVILLVKQIVNFGTLVLRPIRRLLVDRNVSCLTTPTSMLLQIQNIQRMKEKFSFISLVRKSLTRLWRQCNLSSMMNKQSIHLICGRVQTSS